MAAVLVSASSLVTSVYAEFNKITLRTAIGFVVMGFIGFFVKLIFIVSFATCVHSVLGSSSGKGLSYFA